MKFHEKISEYCKENGVRKNWIAAKLEMPVSQFFYITKGEKRLPKKYWKKIIKITGGFISPSDLIQDYFSEDDVVRVEVCSETECKISLK